MLTLSIAAHDGITLTLPVTKAPGRVWFGDYSQPYVYPSVCQEHEDRLCAIHPELLDAIIESFVDNESTSDVVERDECYVYWQFALNGEPATYSEMYAFLNQ
jgi:hypothetical protein